MAKRSKVDILREREEKAYRAYQKLVDELNSLERRPAPVPSCTACGVVFASAYDFDAHYLVDDERYLNLGNCPTRYNNGRLMPLLHAWWGGESLYDEAHRLNETKDKLQAKGTPITLSDYNKLTQECSD